MGKSYNANTKLDALDGASATSAAADVKPTLGSDTQGDKYATVKDNSSGAASTDSANPKYNPTKISGKGSVTKQEAIATAISGNGAASGSGVAPTMMNAGLRAIPYSGADARIIDNASGTPAFNKSDRRDSRYGQKTDNTARHINYVPSETYKLEYDGPKPLSESPDAVQGSLGHPANEYARIQKLAEGFPGAYNFERSVDENTDDILIAEQGQQTKYVNGADSYGDIDPSITFDKANPNEPVPYVLHRGNFVPRTMHAQYSDSGELTDFFYTEDSFTSEVEGDLTAERASTHTVTAANRAEVDRQSMASKAGNEVKDDWSPIPYAYPQPTKDVLYLSTVEKQLGSQVFTAVKMASKAHSYALNKATKDGMRPVSGGAEIALGSAYVSSRSSDYDRFTFGPASSSNSVFHAAYTSTGAPSAIIAMYDSIAKYHDRGDVLTQPRSLNMILKQGISGYKSFKVDPEFAKILDNVNTFSTIDRTYDPSSPVCIMDTIGLMNPYSLNELGSCYRSFKAGAVLAELNVDVDDINEIISYPAASLTQVAEVDGILTSTADYYITTPVILDESDDTFDAYMANLRTNIAGLMPSIRRDIFSKMKHEAFSSDGIAIPVVQSSNGSTATKEALFFIILSYADIDLSNKEFTVCNDIMTEDEHFVSNPLFADHRFTANSLTSDDVPFLNDPSWIRNNRVYNDYLAAWYKNRQNWFYVELRDPYTDGIKKFLRENAGLVGKATLNGAIHWPIQYSTKTMTAYSFLVMASIKYMQEQRALAFIDVLNYSNNFGYPFSDCDNTGDYPALGGTNYGQSDIFELLEVREMRPVTALRWVYPEVYANLPTAEGHTVMHPFYMNEDNFDVTDTELALSYERASMSYPVTKSGVRWSYSDLIYGFSERDARLILDMMVTPPAFKGRDVLSNDGAYSVYKYSQASDGLVCIAGDITIHDHICTPRELGYLFPVKGGYLSSEPVASPAAGDRRYASSAIINGHSAHRVVCWVNESGTPASTILASGSSVIQRAANFTQKYYIFNVYEPHPGNVIGVNFKTGDGFTASGEATADVSLFTPFTTGVNVAGSQPVAAGAGSLVTDVKMKWARLQKLPFALSPFDFGGSLVKYDPFSFNYLYGLVGFRASDFKEDLYNRLQRKMSENWLFVSDPFVEDSLLIK